MNHRHSFCIVYTVLNPLSPHIRIPCLSKTAKTKLTLLEKVPVNSLRFDVSMHSTATLYSSNQKPTPGTSFKFDVRTHLTATLYSSNQQPTFGKLYGQTPKGFCLWFSLGGKTGFS